MPRSQDGRWTRICKVCKSEFQQRRPGQRTCGVLCRAQLPHNTGGVRIKAGLDPRYCENPECRRSFQPARESQVACSRTCLLKCPTYIKSQERAETKRADSRRGSGYRQLGKSADPELQRFRNLRNNLRQLYGITITHEQYRTWLSRQDSACKICGKPAQGKNGHTDHDHKTKRLRDLLCGNCNRGIGAFKDDPDLLRTAAAYIEWHRMAAVT